MQYIKLEDILTKTNKLNSAIIRRDWFKETDLYKKILKETEILNQFPNVTFQQRFWFLKNNLEIKKCQVCSKDYVEYDKQEGSLTHCAHKKNYKKGISNQNLSKSRQKLKYQLLESLDVNGLFLSDIEFKKQLNAFNNRPNSAVLHFGKANNSLIHDIVIKTRNIISIDKNNLELSERIYLINNNLREIPKCPYCNKNAVFNNRIAGYFETCGNKNCVGQSVKKTVKRINQKFVLNNIDTNKYKIINFPDDNFSNSPITIYCNSCEKQSEIYLRNGNFKNFNNLELCSYCELITV